MIWKCFQLAVQHLELVIATVEGRSAFELAGYLVLGGQIVFGQVISHLCDWMYCDTAATIYKTFHHRGLYHSMSVGLVFSLV